MYLGPFVVGYNPLVLNQTPSAALPLKYATATQKNTNIHKEVRRTENIIISSTSRKELALA